MVGTKRKTVIPKAAVARIIMDAGAKRVSADGVDALTAALEKIAHDIAHQAARIAAHSGRKTVQEGDIALAVKK
ncbi:NFYB/HAP3 family transcription factor subunit [Candidatus Woesearchaeota archaeon]|nr:NFYB/HAP3 family transcription factor subunit [Candidatus Woesearchaeota archaeon]